MSEVEKAIAEYTKERRRQYMLEYRQRPEVQARIRAYRQQPEVRERQNGLLRAYRQQAEAKEKKRAYQREYMRRPEVKVRNLAYQREYRLQHPELKARQREKYAAKARQTKIEKAIALLEAEGYTIIKEDHENE